MDRFTTLPLDILDEIGSSLTHSTWALPAHGILAASPLIHPNTATHAALASLCLTSKACHEAFTSWLYRKLSASNLQSANLRDSLVCNSKLPLLVREATWSLYLARPRNGYQHPGPVPSDMTLFHTTVDLLFQLMNLKALHVVIDYSMRSTLHDLSGYTWSDTVDFEDLGFLSQLESFKISCTCLSDISLPVFAPAFEPEASLRRLTLQNLSPDWIKSHRLYPGLSELSISGIPLSTTLLPAIARPHVTQLSIYGLRVDTGIDLVAFPNLQTLSIIDPSFEAEGFNTAGTLRKLWSSFPACKALSILLMDVGDSEDVAVLVQSLQFLPNLQSFSVQMVARRPVPSSIYLSLLSLCYVCIDATFDHYADQDFSAIASRDMYEHPLTVSRRYFAPLLRVNEGRIGLRLRYKYKLPDGERKEVVFINEKGESLHRYGAHWSIPSKAQRDGHYY